MPQPLALVFYERLMPGSQLVNRLQDLNYRVLVLNSVALLVATAKREKPLLLLADLSTSGDICGAIAKIKSEADTSHLPVIAFAPENEPGLIEAAQQAGANFAVTETGLASHLPHMIDRAVQVD
jgi:CheY-like chemotaxis protein